MQQAAQSGPLPEPFSPDATDFAASMTDERLTDKAAEDSMHAGLQSKTSYSNIVVESDGPESDRPETTASMGMPRLPFSDIPIACIEQSASCRCRVHA